MTKACTYPAFEPIGLGLYFILFGWTVLRSVWLDCTSFCLLHPGSLLAGTSRVSRLSLLWAAWLTCRKQYRKSNWLEIKLWVKSPTWKEIIKHKQTKQKKQENLLWCAQKDKNQYICAVTQSTIQDWSEKNWRTFCSIGGISPLSLISWLIQEELKKRRRKMAGV